MTKRRPKPLTRLRIAMDRKKRRELRMKIRAAMARHDEAIIASE